MIVQDIVEKLDELAPLAYAEDYDNIGLLIGDKKEKVKGQQQVFPSMTQCTFITHIKI